MVSIEMPDFVAATLHLDEEQGKRRLLEMVAVEGYRSGEFSRGQVSEMLGQSYYETEVFLKEHGCGLGVTAQKHAEDGQRIREFLAR